MPIPPPLPLTEEERGRRVRAHALEFADATIPGIRDCIKERADKLCPTGTTYHKPCPYHDQAREARTRLSEVRDLMVQFADALPATDEKRNALAEALLGTYRDFESNYEALGIRLSQADSLPGFLARQLSAEVRKIADFLRQY